MCLFLEIDSNNIFQDIHHWKAESLSFPTVCGTILETFFSYNASLVNRCVLKHRSRLHARGLFSAAWALPNVLANLTINKPHSFVCRTFQYLVGWLKSRDGVKFPWAEKGRGGLRALTHPSFAICRTFREKAKRGVMFDTPRKN